MSPLADICKFNQINVLVNTPHTCRRREATLLLHVFPEDLMANRLIGMDSLILA